MRPSPQAASLCWRRKLAKTIADFVDFIVPHAPDVPEVVAQHAIREAIVRFMRETRIAVAELILPTQCNVPDYPLITPECRRLIQVEQVFVDKDDRPVITNFSGRVRPARDFGTGGSGMHYFAGGWRVEHVGDEHDAAIVFHGPPARDQFIKVHYSWAISRDDCAVPDFIYEEWMEAVRHAALYQLYIMAGQEWTNPSLAAHHEGAYQTERRRAKNRKWTSRSPAPIRARAPRFI